MNKELALKKWDERALKNLVDVKNILNGSGINFWLDYGTLLGAIRDGKLNDWMKDIDLGIMNRNWNEFTSIFPKFKANGFIIKIKKFRIHDMIFRTVKLFRYGISIDFSVYKIVGNYAIDLHGEIYTFPWASILNIPYQISQIPFHIFELPKVIRNNRLIRYFNLLPSKSKVPSSYLVRCILGWKIYYYTIFLKNYFEKLNHIKIHGIQFNIPSNIENYLSYMYGIDWRIPNKHFHTYKDNGAFRVILARNKITT